LQFTLPEESTIPMEAFNTLSNHPALVALSMIRNDAAFLLRDKGGFISGHEEAFIEHRPILFFSSPSLAKRYRVAKDSEHRIAVIGSPLS
jgi:hypothetical protein